MAFEIMRLTPLGSASIWYCQPGDWEHLKEDLPEMQNSNSFIDSLLLNLHRMCIKDEKTLLETLTGTGNLAVAQAAFSTYGKRSQQTTTRAESIWATMFLNFQLLDCLLWYRNCSLEGCVRPTANNFHWVSGQRLKRSFPNIMKLGSIGKHSFLILSQL